MRIIFLSKYQGRVERGVENYVVELAPRLAKLGNEVEILTSFWQLLRSDLPRSDLGRSDLKIIYPLNGYWQTLGCRIYSWLTGAKLILGGHAGVGRDDRWNLFMFPDLFIAFSRKGYEWAKKVNPIVKIVKIPHGVDLMKFSQAISLAKFARSPSPSLTLGQAPRWRSGWPQTAAVSLANLPTSIAISEPVKLDLERPIVVTAAHLEPYKRVDLTVKAVAELKKGSLLVLGDGPMEKEIDELGSRLLNNQSSRALARDPAGIATARRGGPRNDEDKRRRYLRLVVPHERVAGYLRAADVFTLASEESEAFGLVYLEAMACGLPVVATDDSLRRELVGDHAAIRLSAKSRRAGAGVFVKNPEDSREYARCLEMAIRVDWGDKPVKQAKRFDWEKIAERYLEEFTGL